MKLNEQGKNNIALAEKSMGALMKLRERFCKQKPFKGLRIGMALHITKETAVLVRTLQDGGASVAICSCNPLSTQDDVAEALRKEGTEVCGYKGESTKEYYAFLKKVIETKPHITIDDGCDLVSEIHQHYPKLIPNIIGGCEETTTGVIRLQAMQKDKALRYPIIAVNENRTKHLMDNYYGTGQSTIDGIIRSSNILFAGKTVVILGYGNCGKGVAKVAKGLGSNIIVTEIDDFAALQAKMDGHRVMKMSDASREGDIFITVTGNIHVIRGEHMKLMKDGALLANSGHFNHEIDLDGLKKLSKSVKRVRQYHYLDEYILKNGKSLFLAGEGRLVNLVSGEGHPSEVMSMSFCGQALACEYLVKHQGKLKNEVITLPKHIDDSIAKLQLEALNVKIDSLTSEQKKYLASWRHGT